MQNNTESPTPAISPKIVLSFGILAVSTASLLIRSAQAEAPSLVVAAYRLTIASLLLTPFIFIKYKTEIMQLTNNQLLPMLLSGFFLAIHFGTWITSLSLTSIASSVVLVTTTPLWVAILASMLLKEKLTKALIIGLIVSMLGGIIVGLSESCTISIDGMQCALPEGFFQSKTLLGNFMALIGAWMAAAYFIVGRKVRETVSTMVYVYVVYAAAAFFLILTCVFLKQPLSGYSPRFYLWAFLLALLPQIIGHTTYNWALGYLPTTFVSISLLGEPIGTILLSFLILHETPTLTEAIGGILLLIGIYLASQSTTQK